MAPTSVLRTALRSTSSFLSSPTTTTSSRSALSTIIVPLSTSRTISTTRRALQQGQVQTQEQEQRASRTSPTPPMLPASLRQYPYTLKVGTVTRVGGMDRTVRVAHRHTVWDRHIRKMYPKVTTYLVSDPRESLREGDVIEFSSGAPKSRLVRHVVERIIAPFGEAIENRPPVMSREERDAERAEKRLRKIARRQERDPTAATTGGDPDRVGRIRGLVMERLAEEEKRRTKESAT